MKAPCGGGTFGRYLLLEQLGEGGMAQIWRARPVDHSREELAIKTLHPHLRGQRLFTELFAAEARVTRELSHPGIVRILDDGKVRGLPFLAMQRVDGWDLAALHRTLRGDRRVPVDIALAITIELCRAVGYAHDHRDERGRARPIVHGDLSPSNVMVRKDGHVTVIDFGVAHMSPRRGRAQLVIGKSGYLAPELLDEAAADPRTDVFSIGVLLHELLANRHLFVVESERETLRRVSEVTIPPPSRANPNVTRELDRIVLQALDRDADRRFPSANELAYALERIDQKAATPERVAAFMRQTLPMNSMPKRRESTATIHKRARRAVTSPQRPRRRSASLPTRMFLAAAVLIAIFLAPIPRDVSEWWPQLKRLACAYATDDGCAPESTRPR